MNINNVLSLQAVDRLMEEEYGVTYTEMLEMAPSMQLKTSGGNEDAFVAEFGQTFGLVPLDNVRASRAADINLRKAAVNSFAENRDGWVMDEKSCAWTQTPENFVFVMSVSENGQLFVFSEAQGSFPNELKLDGLGRVNSSDIKAACGDFVEAVVDTDIGDLIKNELRTHLYRDRAPALTNTFSQAI